MNIQNFKRYDWIKCCYINSTHCKNFGGKSQRVCPLPLFREMHSTYIYIILESAGKIRFHIVEIMTIHLKTINNLPLSLSLSLFLSLSSTFILLTYDTYKSSVFNNENSSWIIIKMLIRQVPDFAHWFMQLINSTALNSLSTSFSLSLFFLSISVCFSLSLSNFLSASLSFSRARAPFLSLLFSGFQHF